MKKIDSPADSSFILRMLYIPCIIQTLKIVLWNSPKNPTFPAPRFDVFKPFLTTQNQTKEQNYLLKTLISKFKYQIILGLLVTAIWVMLNLFTPSIVKEFFTLMKLQTLEATHIHTATYITQKFVALQLLRAFFSGHVSRMFYELSLKVEGSLGSQIIGKALRLNSECRLRLPDSEVFQLQNVDLKIISKFFSHLWLSLEIPLTLLVAVALLFRQSMTFGFVGLYWILLAFFWQRWLSDKLISCNLKNNQSIEERSKANYQVLEKFRLARLDHSQSLLIEQNNRYFLRQHKNQEQFNQHQALFEISLVLLPIVVVITIFIYDKNESVHITIQEVYLLLTLLGICYKPLKNLQKFMILIFNAIHSLRRIEIYLDLPENNRARSKYIKNDESFEPYLKIKRNTMTMLRVHNNRTTGARAGFYADQQIKSNAGSRLVILGRKGQGTSIFLRSLIGQVYTVNGMIKLEGSLAYLPEVNEFFPDTIIANIAFYNKQVSEAQVIQITSLLGLDKDLKFKNGLKEVLEQGKFTDIQLKKIGIARVLCSKRKVYLLDSPFLGLSTDIVQKLQKFLRLKQQQGVMIIMTQKYIRLGQNDDMILIISQGQIQEYGRYDQLMKKPSSSLHSFLLTQNIALCDRLSFLPVIQQFQQKIKKILLLQTFAEKKEEKKQQNIILNKLLSAVGKYTVKLKNENDIKKRALKLQKKTGALTFFQYFINQLHLSQWFFISVIILVSQLLHVFIQYQIGQQYKKGGSVTLKSLAQLVKFQLFITCGLAFLIYLQYHTISLISNIIGNKIYEGSLTSASNKGMSWYNKTPAPLIANKYNHDYSQIYNMVKYLMDIIKYFIVLITTLLLIDASPNIIIALTSIIALFYLFLLKFFRKGQLTLLKCHAVYKHDFVTVFDEVIQGGLLINIFGKNRQAYEKAKNGFISVSSYRQAVNNAKIFQNLVCQLATTLIIALGLQYGTIIKIKEGQQNQALVAVSVLLLFNLSDVFKSLMKTIISAESFFKLKLIPVIEVIDIEKPITNEPASPKLLKYNICFSQVIIKSKEDSIFEIYPLTLNIAQGQNIILYQQDSFLRNNLLLALTNNLPDCSEGKFNSDVIKIGSVNIRQIQKQVLGKYMGVVLPENFYFSGTLFQNLRWKNKNFDQKKALLLAQQLKLNKEVPQLSVMGLNSPIQVTDSHRELSRKLAVMKAILRKVKILVIKDTPWFVAGRSIVELFKAHGLKSTTIVGITSDLSGCEGAERLVYLQKFRVIEDAKVQQMMKSSLSLGGALLRSCRFRSLDYWRDEEDAVIQKAVTVNRPNKTLLKSILKYSKHLN